MIEVTLVSTADKYSDVGRIVNRKRANLAKLGVNKNQFIKGFLKANLSELELALSNDSLVEFISSDLMMSNKDFESINYLLGEAGFKLLVYFVADDEANPETVSAGKYEYNIVDESFRQDDLPTVTKITTDAGKSVASVLVKVMTSSGFFDQNKLKGVANPLTKLINAVKDSDKTLGTPGMMVNQVYSVLEYLGIKIKVVIGQ